MKMPQLMPQAEAFLQSLQAGVDGRLHPYHARVIGERRPAAPPGCCPVFNPRQCRVAKARAAALLLWRTSAHPPACCRCRQRCVYMLHAAAAGPPTEQPRHPCRRPPPPSPAADSLAPLINLALRRGDALGVFNYSVALWEAENAIQGRYSLHQLQYLNAIIDTSAAKATHAQSAVVKRQFEKKLKAAKVGGQGGPEAVDRPGARCFDPASPALKI